MVLRAGARMRGTMRCDHACGNPREHVGAQDCCHTCLYFTGAECTAPEGYSFYPRLLWRMAREA